MDELKPCPFCGGKAVFEQFDNPKKLVRCTLHCMWLSNGWFSHKPF